MAAVNTKSTAITNADSTQPHTPVPSYLAGPALRCSIGVAEVAAADDDNSVYRFVRLPSGAVVLRIEVLNDAITAGTSYDLGLYKTARDGAAVVDADVFATAIDMSTERLLPFDAMFEVQNIDKSEKRLWEHAGLSADPFIEYDVALTANTVGSAAGTIVLRVYWVV